MTVTVAILEQGADPGTGEPFDTGSITWSGGVAVIFVVSAYSSSAFITHVATKSGDTWTSRGQTQFGSRRSCAMITNLSPSDGVITIDVTGNAGTYQDSVYFVCEFSGSDGAIPTNIDTDFGASETGPQTLPLTDTINAGDLAIFFGCSENAAGHAVDGITLVGSVATSSNTRSALLGKTTSDTTPGHTWTGSNSNAAIACVFRVAAASGSTFTIEGAGVTSFSGGSEFLGTYAIIGVATPSLVGGSLFEGDLAVAGTAISTFVAAGTSEYSITGDAIVSAVGKSSFGGVTNIAGAAVVTGVGIALHIADTSIVGAAVGSFTGLSLVSGDVAISGSAIAAMEGKSVVEVLLASIGSSSVLFLSNTITDAVSGGILQRRRRRV